MSEVVIPKGWTYFTHRTNTNKWENNPMDSETIFVKRIMSVVTEDEVHQELLHYGKRHMQAFSFGEGEPFEIRCLICSLSYLQTLPDENMKNMMLKEFYYDRRNFGGAYGQRHHSIPPEEELLVLGIGNYDEVFEKEQKIIWTIPKRFYTFYQEEILKGNNRTISFQEVGKTY